MTRWVMPKIQPTTEPKKEPDDTPESTVPEASGKRGCPTSFLLQKKGEMDKLCGGAGGDVKEEYVQPDTEKESGGEG